MLILSYLCHLIIRRTRSNLTILSSFPKHPLEKASWHPVKTTQGNEKTFRCRTHFMESTNSKTQNLNQKNLLQTTTDPQTNKGKSCPPPPTPHPVPLSGGNTFHVRFSFACQNLLSTLVSVTSKACLVVDITVSSLCLFIISYQHLF